MSVRRLISRLVLLVAVLVVLILGGNSAFSSHRTADIWPNGQAVAGDTMDVSSITDIA
jgi:hypothetical protein